MHKCTANIIICRIFMFKNLKRNSMKKISAVEWLEEKWNNYDLNLGKSGFSLLLKQAKEMEQQQIIDTYISGYTNGVESMIDENLSVPSPKEYYNETFKSE